MANSAEQFAPEAASAAAQLIAYANRLAKAGNSAEACLRYRQVLEEQPDNLEARYNLAMVLAGDGELDASIENLKRVMAIDPSFMAARQNYLGMNMMQGNEATRNLVFARSIPYYRNVLAIEPENIAARINLSNALAITHTHGELADFDNATHPRIGNHVLIACMPKSGSSFLFQSLQRLTGWPKADLSYAYLQNEQEIHLPYLLRSVEQDTITQQHCRATEPNVQILQAFGFRPVVLVRNLFDIVMSLSDFYDSGATLNTVIGDDWRAFDVEEKHDFIIDQVIPWYVAFYASWRHAAHRAALECLFVCYEDMIADKPGTLFRVADFTGLGKTKAECAAAVGDAEGDKTATRFNQGVAGRGESELSRRQKDRVRRLAEAYRSIDFSPVGI